MWFWRHILPAFKPKCIELVNIHCLTFRSLLLPNLANHFGEMDPWDERFLRGKQRRICISLFVCSYKFPPFLTYSILSIWAPRIPSYLHNWRDRGGRRGSWRYRWLLHSLRRVTARCQHYWRGRKRLRGVTIIIMRQVLGRSVCDRLAIPRKWKTLRKLLCHISTLASRPSWMMWHPD